MSDSVRPHRRPPTRLPRLWDSPGKNTGVGCHFLLQCMKVKVKGKSLSRVQLFTTPWTAAYQAPPSMGFSRRECWSGVPLPSPISHANQKNCSFKPTESDSMERGPRICPHLACSQMILKHTTEFSPASSLTFRRAL